VTIFLEVELLQKSLFVLPAEAAIELPDLLDLGLRRSVGLPSFARARRRRLTCREVLRGHLLSEINVTPLVDVMLVLLIIFYGHGAHDDAGVDVKLPETSAPASQ